MLLVITLVEHAKTTICIAPEVTSLACVQGMLIVAVAHHIQVKKQHYDIRYQSEHRSASSRLDGKSRAMFRLIRYMIRFEHTSRLFYCIT